MGARWKDGELYALWADVWLAEAETPLSTVRTLRLRRLLEQGKYHGGIVTCA